MKSYSIAQLKKLGKEQNYKFAALEDSDGKRLQSFNNLKQADLQKQLTIIQNRLNSELFDDGIYTVLMCSTINRMAIADKYPTVKGVLKPQDIKIDTPTILSNASEHVLTWDSALKMQQEISTLKAEVQQLKFENNLLQSEIDSIDENAENLGEGTQNETTLKSGTQTFLSETLPSLLPILDRYFDSEDKKLNLKRLELESKRRTAQPLRKPIQTGSQEHLNIIEHYFKTKNEKRFDEELDKLEEFNESLYIEVCKKLGIETEESEEGTDDK